MICTITGILVLIYVHMLFCKMESFKKSIAYMYKLSKDCQIQLFFLKIKFNVRKRFFGTSLLLLLIFFQTWIYKKKNVLKNFQCSNNYSLQAGLIYVTSLVVYQSCLLVTHFILLEYSRTYYFHRYNEPFPPKVMKTSLFWGRCRAPQTVVDLCALGRK